MKITIVCRVNISFLHSSEFDLAKGANHELSRAPQGFELNLWQSGKAGTGTKNNNAQSSRRLEEVIERARGRFKFAWKAIGERHPAFPVLSRVRHHNFDPGPCGIESQALVYNHALYRGDRAHLFCRGYKERSHQYSCSS